MIDSEKREPIKIYFNNASGRGNICAMFTLIDSIKMSKTPIETINMGYLSNESFYVYLAGHKRYSYQNATFVLNELDYICGDELNSAKPTNQVMKNQIDIIKNFVLDRTTVSEKNYDNKIIGASSGWWISAEDALRYKICHSIINTY